MSKEPLPEEYSLSFEENQKDDPSTNIYISLTKTSSGQVKSPQGSEQNEESLPPSILDDLEEPTTFVHNDPAKEQNKEDLPPSILEDLEETTSAELVANEVKATEKNEEEIIIPEKETEIKIVGEVVVRMPYDDIDQN